MVEMEWKPFPSVFLSSTAREDEMRRVNLWCLKWALNPHPSMNQIPKGAAPEIVVVGYGFVSAKLVAPKSRSRRCG